MRDLLYNAPYFILAAGSAIGFWKTRRSNVTALPLLLLLSYWWLVRADIPVVTDWGLDIHLHLMGASLPAMMLLLMWVPGRGTIFVAATPLLIVNIGYLYRSRTLAHLLAIRGLSTVFPAWKLADLAALPLLIYGCLVLWKVRTIRELMFHGAVITACGVLLSGYNTLLLGSFLTADAYAILAGVYTGAGLLLIGSHATIR